jgi:hypothetical protein
VLFHQATGLILGEPPLLPFFLVVPETPVPLLGQDLLSQLKVQIVLQPGEYFCFPLIEEQVDPTIWTDGTTVCQAKAALSVQIKLKDPLQFPH